MHPNKIGNDADNSVYDLASHSVQLLWNIATQTTTTSEVCIRFRRDSVMRNENNYKLQTISYEKKPSKIRMVELRRKVLKKVLKTGSRWQSKWDCSHLIFLIKEEMNVVLF